VFNVLIDTSVWLDFAQDEKQTPLLSIVEEMVKDGEINLLVPSIVVTEFRKNSPRVAKSSAKSLTTHFQLVKDAVRRYEGDADKKEAVLSLLSDVDHRIPLIGGAAQSTLKRINALLDNAKIIEPSDTAKLKATERALNRKAPCHHENKNSIADAILIETYFECVKKGAARQRFAFVTHNKHDFSLVNGNQKLPHADLAPSFSRIKSMYFINLTECLRRIDPIRVTDFMWEQEWTQEPRGLSELLEAMRVLERKIWYIRHRNLEYKIKVGKVKVVDRSTWEKNGGNNNVMIIDEIWKGALKSARQTEKDLGKENVGPWNDFEWGMLNGKLSALRWALGEEWDELYT
jgi:hypothetical protein